MKIKYKLKGDIISIIEDAYKEGYKQRICDQLEGALNGKPVGSSYSDDNLNRLSKNFVKKNYEQ